MRRGRPHAEAGLVLIAVLIAVALAAAAASVAVSRWSDEIHREQEQELMRVGDAIAGAIASYRRASAGSAMKHPPELEDLLDDRRAFATLRHLRQLYPDPTMRGAPWGVIRAPDGGVLGVYSRNEATPWRRGTVRLDHVDLTSATSYAQWRFIPREALR